MESTSGKIHPFLFFTNIPKDMGIKCRLRKRLKTYYTLPTILIFSQYSWIVMVPGPWLCIGVLSDNNMHVLFLAWATVPCRWLPICYGVSLIYSNVCNRRSWYLATTWSQQCYHVNYQILNRNSFRYVDQYRALLPPQLLWEQAAILSFKVTALKCYISF